MTQNLVREYYARSALYEWRRLVRDPYHRLEFDTTMYFLKKYLPRRGIVLDAGGGPGRYTIELAKMGYEVVLLDLTPEVLQIARKKIEKEKVTKNVREIVCSSIIDLSAFKSNTFDAVICLGGPLSHIINRKKRKRAVEELVRIAKRKAPLFVSVIGRLAVCMNAVVYAWPEMLTAPDVFRKYTIKGDYLGGYGFTACHFYSPGELEEGFEKKTKILKMVGLEGIFSTHRREYKKIIRQEKYKKILWETHLKTCTHPSIVGISEHFMLVARKR